MKVFFSKNKLIFWALLELGMILVAGNLYIESKTITVAMVCIVVLPILYPILSPTALATITYSEQGITIERYGKTICTHDFKTSEVGVYMKRIGLRQNYYLYVSKPNPILELNRPSLTDIVSMTVNNDNVRNLLAYYNGDIKAYDILPARQREIFERVRRTIRNK